MTKISAKNASWRARKVTKVVANEWLLGRYDSDKSSGQRMANGVLG